MSQKIRIKLKSYDHMLVSTEKIDGVVTKKLFTVISVSPHVNKKQETI
jgi:ribosomal protein S10